MFIILETVFTIFTFCPIFFLSTNIILYFILTIVNVELVSNRDISSNTFSARETFLTITDTSENFIHFYVPAYCFIRKQIYERYSERATIRFVYKQRPEESIFKVRLNKKCQTWIFLVKKKTNKIIVI